MPIKLVKSSWFKYISKNNHRYVGLHIQELGEYQMDNPSYYINNRSIKQKQDNPFFRRPRVKINHQLRRHDIRISVSGRTAEGPVTPELFNGIIWTIEANNKFPLISRPVEGYSAQLYIKNIETWISLLWRRPTREIVTSFQTGAGLIEGHNYRYEFQRRLGHDYLEVINDIGTETGDIEGRESRELLFLFTFENSNFAYLITSSDNTDAWYDDNTFSKQIDDVFLMLPIPSQTEIRLRFESDKIHRYNLQINDFNNIQLNPIRR